MEENISHYFHFIATLMSQTVLWLIRTPTISKWTHLIKSNHLIVAVYISFTGQYILPMVFSFASVEFLRRMRLLLKHSATYSLLSNLRATLEEHFACAHIPVVQVACHCFLGTCGHCFAVAVGEGSVVQLVRPGWEKRQTKTMWENKSSWTIVSVVLCFCSGTDTPLRTALLLFVIKDVI